MFLGVSGTVVGMDLSKEDRTALGILVEEERRKRYGTKRAAYSSAGLNAATWDRIEAGEVVREDRLMNALDALWPEAQRDPRNVLTQEMPAGSGFRYPVATPRPYPSMEEFQVLVETVRQLDDRVTELEEREEGGSGGDTAAIDAGTDLPEATSASAKASAESLDRPSGKKPSSSRGAEQEVET